MPRYDYKCNVCSYIEEHEHSMTEDHNGQDCNNPYDHCAGSVNRVFQATPAVFKGTGWANKGPTYKSPKGSYE